MGLPRRANAGRDHRIAPLHAQYSRFRRGAPGSRSPFTTPIRRTLKRAAASARRQRDRELARLSREELA